MNGKDVHSAARAEQLQFLRFLAFLNVFLYHAECWNFMNYPVSHSGSLAVRFFIMLSGLVTGYSRYGREAYPSIQNICKDMRGKVLKIYPVYFLILMITVMLGGVPNMINTGNWAGLRGFSVNLLQGALLLQAWPGVGGTLWFLSTIMFLYLLNLPAMWLIHKVKEHRLRYFFLGGAFVILMVLTALYCRLTRNTDMGYWQYQFPPARIGEYLGGMLLGYAIRDFKSQPILEKIPRVVFTLAEAGALVFWVYSLRRAGSPWMNHIVSWLIPNTVLLGVFTFGMGGISKVFRWKPLAYLGDISFECYVIHHTVIRFFTLNNYTEGDTLASQAFSLCYCLALTVLSAALLHKASGKKSK